ncbi:hypothetical protein [Spiroplasma endosymbiont of Diplazon laetatorius]|uniref:hypothetical protein n=1 Tax=Spiroplasma endosymbiont of Diplazon laetatorius TaxID=3066322 RepID=UPI0030CCF04E
MFFSIFFSFIVSLFSSLPLTLNVGTRIGLQNRIINEITNYAAISPENLEYEKVGNYDIQSQLMLRSDFFNQGINPKNYAFSIGLTPLKDFNDTSTWFDSSSIDSNNSKYWVKLWVLYFYTQLSSYSFYDLDLVIKDKEYFSFQIYKDKFSLLDVVNNKEFEFKVTGGSGKENIYYDFFNVLFTPLIENQSPYSFNSSRLVFNFDFENALNKFFDKYKLNQEYNINEIINLFNSFYRNLVQFIFDLDPDTNVIMNMPYSTVLKKHFINYNIFIKNGFNLYPKGLLLNMDKRMVAGNEVLPFSFQARYDNISNIIYDSNQNYYQYLNSKSSIFDYSTSSSKNAPPDIELVNYAIENQIKGFNSFSTILGFNSSSTDRIKNIILRDLNFTIYNSNDWNNVVQNPSGNFNIPYMTCSISNLFGCVTNAGIYLINTVLDFTGFNKITGPLIQSLVGTTELLKSIQNLFAFNVTFSLMVYSILTLAIAIALGKIF